MQEGRGCHMLSLWTQRLGKSQVYPCNVGMSTEDDGNRRQSSAPFSIANLVSIRKDNFEKNYKKIDALMHSFIFLDYAYLE